MPLIQYSGDTLPYVEPAPSSDALHAAKTLIQAEMASEPTPTIHPSIPNIREHRFSDLVEAEHARITAGQEKSNRLDFSRYNLLDAPGAGDLPAWNATLQKAYANAEYLRGRETNLGLLETYGKNAWLIGNSNVEDSLRAVEREVEASKLELEQIEQARRATQSNASSEIQGLEEAWRTGVRRMIETQAAGEKLRQEILQRKRNAAS